MIFMTASRVKISVIDRSILFKIYILMDSGSLSGYSRAKVRVETMMKNMIA